MKYPSAYCSVPTETAHRRQHYRYKTQMMRSVLQKAPRTGKRRQVYIQPARQLFQIKRQMLRKKSRWSLIFRAQIHCTWLLKGKIYPWVHPPHTPDFIYAFSLKEPAFHRMFFQNKSEVYFWATMLLFCYLAAEVSRFCWLLSTPALQSGWHHLNMQVCNGEKLLLHLQCACCRVCRWTKEHRNRSKDYTRYH